MKKNIITVLAAFAMLFVMGFLTVSFGLIGFAVAFILAVILDKILK